MENIVVVGAGVMGSALAVHLGNKDYKVNLWGTSRDTKSIDEMKKTKRQEELGVKIPNKIAFYYHNELERAFSNTKLIVVAVSSEGMEAIIKTISPYVKENHIIVSVTKGIDEKNLYSMSTVIKNSLSQETRDKVGIVKLGGPIIAMELAEGRYTEGIFASENRKAAKYTRDIFRTPKFKAKLTSDILGVDLCAAFKNSYAIGMGIIEGLEGDSNNAKAALMARGTIEMSHIVKAYGGSRQTALGIAGVGDYYVTAQGGRNGRFGRLIGEGNTIDDALKIMENQTIEGLPVTFNGYKLLKALEKEKRINIKKETPLFLELYKILYESKSAAEGIQSYWLSE